MKKKLLIGAILLIAGIVAMAAYTGVTAMLATTATLTAGQTLSCTSTSTVINTESQPGYRYNKAALFLYAKGAAALSSGVMTFTFQRSPDNVNWHDLPAVTVTLSGTSQVVNSDTTKDLDLSCTHYMRLKQIQNADAFYSADANVYFELK